MTAFTQGDRVRSRVTAQGLVEGDLYDVTAVVERELGMFGTLVSYWLRPADSATRAAKQTQYLVSNGHLLLEVA